MDVARVGLKDGEDLAFVGTENDHAMQLKFTIDAQRLVVTTGVQRSKFTPQRQ